jgi:hypothetical protein
MLTVNYYFAYKIYISMLQLDLVQRSEVLTKDFIVTLYSHAFESALHMSTLHKLMEPWYACWYNDEAAGWTVWGSNPGRGKRFFSSPKLSD